MLEEKKSSKMSGLSIWTEQLQSWMYGSDFDRENLRKSCHVFTSIAMITYAPLGPLGIIERFGGCYGLTEKSEKPYFFYSCC